MSKRYLIGAGIGLIGILLLIIIVLFLPRGGADPASPPTPTLIATIPPTVELPFTPGLFSSGEEPSARGEVEVPSGDVVEETGIEDDPSTSEDDDQPTASQNNPAQDTPTPSSEPSSEEEDDQVPEEGAKQNPIITSGTGSGTTSTVDLPPGLYRVFFRSQGAFESLTPIIESGECSDYDLFSDEADAFGGSVTYRSVGCEVAFRVDGSSSDWTLSIEAAGRDGLLSPPLTISSDSPSTTGLIDLPPGDYDLHFISESPFSMVIAIVGRGGCLEFPIFLLTAPGEAEAIYSSEGCEVVFQIGSVIATWELSVIAR